MIIRTLYGDEEFESKRCITCNEEKPLSEFSARRHRKNGEPVGNDCKVCHYEKIRQRKELKKLIDVSVATHCELCGASKEELIQKHPNRYDGKPFCIDHDHETGELRGVICRDCNSGLSMFKDDISLLEKAIGYLEEWQENKLISKELLNQSNLLSIANILEKNQPSQES